MKKTLSNRGKAVFAAFFLCALTFAAYAGGSGESAAPASGGSWKPGSPVTIIVPYGAGGGQDVAARIFAKHAEKYAGQKFVAENRTGGSGAIGTTAIANARPDGVTLGMFHNLSLYDQFLVEGVTYTEKSFIPLAIFTADSTVIVVNKKLGVTDIKGLVEKAKASPNRITWGGPEFSSQTYPRMNVENATGVKFGKMIFDGGAAALAAVAGGNCDVTSVFPSEYFAMADNPDIVTIATCGTERMGAVPDIPTMIEQGINATFFQWRAFVAPAGTPDNIVKGYQEIFQKTLDDKDCAAELTKAGFNFVNIGGAKAYPYMMESFEANKDVIVATAKQAKSK
ncbi:MAG: tripartite tricarboxylate transporter substrate binding protein [Spirochaetales bacterium]|jgi:tripartite-type tricarboxylate transporter receptor subunit TctC|nr:tripartite tricarboxylate transporter substrate binding protein [Spirochaetales bacterium]